MNSSCVTGLPTASSQPKYTFCNKLHAYGWARLGIVALLLAVYLGSACSPALLDDADATHAEAAREMVVRGDYVTLHVNGVRYLEKAPFLYWMAAFGFKVFGFNAFAARLPIVLAVLLTSLLAMKWGKEAFGERAGIYAGLFITSTIGYYLFTRILIPEAILSFLIAAALYYFLTGLETGKHWRWYAGYSCIAFAILTKGLIALVFPGAAVVGYLLLSGEWRRWREFRLGTGLLLVIAISAPWHLLAGYRNHGFFWFYFVNEHFLRFLGKRYPKDYNKLPATLYWTLHLVWLFPWSMYLPIAVRDFVRKPVAERTLAARTRLMCWVWAGFVLVFFAISTNQEYYTFPSYFPLLMLLAAAIAGSEESGQKSHWLTWSTVVVTVLSIAAGGTLLAGLWASRHIPYVADIGSVLAAHDLATDTLSMSHMLDLTGESFAALRLPTVLAIIALLIGTSTALVLRLRKRHYAATWALACSMGLFFIAAHVALNRFEPYMSSKALARSIAQQIKQEDKMMIYGDQAFGSSLLFYLERPIYLVSGRSSSMWFGSTFPDAPKIYLHDSDLVREWNSATRVFLFVTPYDKAKVEALIGPQRYLVAASSGKTIYCNRSF